MRPESKSAEILICENKPLPLIKDSSSKKNDLLNMTWDEIIIHSLLPSQLFRCWNWQVPNSVSFVPGSGGEGRYSNR
jgi:hypothetical protein